MKPIKDVRIGVDIGHGTNTPGKGYKYFNEHNFNSEVAMKYIEEIMKFGFTFENFILAQQPHSEEIKLHKRYDLYDGLDFYLSFHANASNNLAAKGLWLMHWKGSKLGTPLAYLFADVYKKYNMDINFSLIEEADTDKSDGTWDNLGILREPYAPGLLIEHGFMTNDHDRSVMSKPEYQRKVAKIWAEASVKFLEDNKIIDKIKIEPSDNANYDELIQENKRLLKENAELNKILDEIHNLSGRG